MDGQEKDPCGCDSSPPTRREPRSSVEIFGANKILRAKIPISRKDKTKSTELIGKSWAADATAFVVPAFDIALDAGYPIYGKRMKDILVSHLHTDHSHHLTHMKSRTNPSNVYVPEETVENAQRFIDVAQMMTSNLTPEQYHEIEWDVALQFKGVRPGQRITLSRKGLVCDIVQCDHGVPCVGFIISQLKTTLKPEYKGLAGREIGKLRKEGVHVTNETTESLFCFLGDTTTDILKEDAEYSKAILSCPTVIIECSFLTDDFKDNAARTKHVLWTELKPIVEENPETTFVLTHFSRRYSVQQVKHLLRDAPSNVVPWVPTETGLYCLPVGGDAEIDEIYTHF